MYSQRLLQRRGWLGLRRYPARSALQRFPVQGDSPCTPGGGCAPCTLLGNGGGVFFCLGAFGAACQPASGSGERDRRLMLTEAVVPPGPPSKVFGYRGAPPCTPGGGCAPCTPLGKRRRRRFPTWRVGMLPSRRGRDSTPFLTFPRVRGQGQSRPQGRGWGWGICGGWERGS